MSDQIYFDYFIIIFTEKLAIHKRLTLSHERTNFVICSTKTKEFESEQRGKKHKKFQQIVIRFDFLFFFLSIVQIYIKCNCEENIECVKLPFSSDSNGVIQMRCCNDQSNMIQWKTTKNFFKTVTNLSSRTRYALKLIADTFIIILQRPIRLRNTIKLTRVRTEFLQFSESRFTVDLMSKLSYAHKREHQFSNFVWSILRPGQFPFYCL